MTGTPEHECVFAPGLPGACECGNTYAAEQVRQSLARFLAGRAGTVVGAAEVQRHCRVGYARSVFLLDELAKAGRIGEPDAKNRYPVPHIPAEQVK